MTASSSQNLILSLSAAHRRHLRSLATTLLSTGNDQSALFLQRLADDLDQIDSSLVPTLRDRLRELDANERTLCEALTHVARLTVEVADLPMNDHDSALLLDAARLRGLATQLSQLAQIAGEAALRAQARAGMLDN
jgi:hypothetical protein